MCQYMVGISIGLILGPLLFNIFINDIFIIIEETNICNFADDNSIYACDTTLSKILKRLEHDIKNVLYWFEINSLKCKS